MDRLESIYRDYYKYVCAYFSGLGYKWPDYEDLVQEVFCKIVKGMDFYRGEGLTSWIRTIAEHVHLNHLRAQNTDKRKHLEISLDQISEKVLGFDSKNIDFQEQYLVQIECLKKVVAVLNGLPKKKKRIAKMKFIYEMEVKEIALALCTQEDAVRVHVHQIRAILKDALGDSMDSLFK